MGDDAAAFAAPDPAVARERFANCLTRAMLDAERRLGRSFDRFELAKRLNISRGSLYAYLKGTTLPSSHTLDMLLAAIEITGPEAGRLSTLRDDAEVVQKLRRSRPAADATRPETSSSQRNRQREPGAIDLAARSVGLNQAVGLDEARAHLPPHQLPAVNRDFVGRHAELMALDQLATQRAGEPPTAIVTIDGTAGAGKTTLAVHWAHQVADRYPDGQLYVNLCGFDPGDPLDPGVALHGFLLALGVGPAAIPHDLEARAALYRSLLARRRMLVLLDNARSADHARRLLPGSSTCLTVVTSRSGLEGLIVRNGAERLPVGVLPHSDAVTLLTRRLGVPSNEVRPELDELAQQCAHLPLALSIAGARTAGRSREALHRLITDLHELRDRLDVLSSDEADLDLRTVFQWSYEPLTPPAARLFALLGLHPGPDIDRFACAALLGVSEVPDQALRGLTEANLLTEHRSDRFASHDLLRGFARELAATRDTAETKMALERMLDYYLVTAETADAAAQPWVRYRHAQADAGEPVPTAARAPATYSEKPGTSHSPRPSIVTYDEAMTWFGDELPVLLSMVEIAATRGFESHAWRLAWALMVFLRRTGRRTERAEVHQAAVKAADRVGHRHARAASQRKLADALARLGRQAEAQALLATALAEFEQLGDNDGARHVHLSFARIFEAEQRYAEALHHARTGLRLARYEPVTGADTAADAPAGDRAVCDENPLAAADCLTLVSTLLCHLGRYEEALSHGFQALDLYTRIGHLEGEANVLRHLGRAEALLGRHTAAIAHYKRSRQLDSQLGDRFWEAQVMNHLADEYLAIGDEATALSWRGQALAILESLSHPDAELVRAKWRAQHVEHPSPRPPSASSRPEKSTR